MPGDENANPGGKLTDKGLHEKIQVFTEKTSEHIDMYMLVVSTCDRGAGQSQPQNHDPQQGVGPDQAIVK